MTPISWLHVTDLHCGPQQQGWLWPNVEQAFFDDLSRMVGRCGKFDLVLFSGDLVQQGGESEYERVDELMAKLNNHLRSLGCDAVWLTVPGNHDLVRPRATSTDVAVLTTWAQQPAQVRENFWSDKDSSLRAVVDQAFANYTNWRDRSKLLKPQQFRAGLLPGDFAATITKDNHVKLGIVGLNSTFLQLTGEEFEGKLAVSLQQIQSVCGGDAGNWARQHQLCLMMTHHPPRWFDAESSRLWGREIAPAGRFAVHLCGHLHEAVSTALMVNGGAAVRVWQGCSLFGLEKWRGNERRQHGFACGRFEFEQDRCHLRLWPRIAWPHPASGWRVIPDVMSFELDLDAADQGTPPEEVSVFSGKPRPQPPSPVWDRLKHEIPDASLLQTMRPQNLPFDDAIIQRRMEAGDGPSIRGAKDAFERYVGGAPVSRLLDAYLIASYLLDRLQSGDPSAFKDRQFAFPIHQYLAQLIAKDPEEQRSRVCDTLKTWLERNDIFETTRNFAAFHLGILRCRAAVPALIASVGNALEMPLVRHYSALALGMIRAKESLDPLLELYRTDLPDEIRRIVAHAIMVISGGWK